jgi:hypothetical protein
MEILEMSEEMINPFADILKSQAEMSTNHLSFEDQCGYYGALKCGVKNNAVALAANIAQPTVSYLRAAGERRGGQIHYARVAREYDNLGHNAFIHKYVTDRIRERCLNARHDIMHGLAKPRASQFVKPRKSGLIGRHTLRPRSSFETEIWAIEIAQRPDGYVYLIVNSPMRGEIRREHAQVFGPFEQARDALRDAKDKLTPED